MHKKEIYIDFVLAVELKNFYVAKKIYNKNKHTIKWAIKIGYLNIVKYLEELNNFSGCNDNIAPTSMDLACEYGHLDIVKWFHKKLYKCTDYAMNHAAKNGHYSIVQWLHKHSHNDINSALNWAKFYNTSIDKHKNLHQNTKVINFLTKLKPIKHIDLISKYIEQLNYNYSYIGSFPVKENTWHWAAVFGDLELIKKLHILDKDNYSTLTMDLAAGNGHLEIVKYLHENGYKGSSLTMNLAVMDNQLEIVKYLYEIKNINVDEAMFLARYNGYFKIMKFLENNKTNDLCIENTFDIFIENKKESSIDVDDSSSQIALRKS